MTKKALVVPAKGIGDALLMMIACFHLQKAGYETTICHPHLHELNTWFPNFRFSKKEDLFSFDRIIVQNDNSFFIEKLKNYRKEKKVKNLSVFYAGYLEKKHGPLDRYDFVFDLFLPMADNIASSCSHLLSNPFSKNIGIFPPSHLKKAKFSKRVAVHPLTEIEKSWPMKRFLCLAKKIKDLGFDVSFVMSEKQRKNHLFVQKHEILLPNLPTLSDLASYLYESKYFIGLDSGPGHLASALDIASIIIAKDRKQMQLWQPGWKKANIVFPSKILLNIKYLRLKEKLWKSFIFPNTIFKIFQKSFVNL